MEVKNCWSCRFEPDWFGESTCKWEPENIPDSVSFDKAEIYTPDGDILEYIDGGGHEQMIGDFNGCPAWQAKEPQI